MTELIIQLSEAQNGVEVDHIVEQNIDRLNPFNVKYFCIFANNAKKRIARVRHEQLRSFKLQLN